MLATERCLFSVEKEAFIKVFFILQKREAYGGGWRSGWMDRRTDRWVG